MLYQLSYAGGAAKYTDSMKQLGFFLVCALLPALAAGQTYRWVDEKGQVHYTQVPPKDRKSETVAPPTPPAANPNQDSLNRALAEGNEGEAGRQKSADRAFQERSNKDTQCRQARDQLAYMDAKTARRLGTTDDKGNVSKVTEEQFQARRAELQEIIAGCG